MGMMFAARNASLKNAKKKTEEKKEAPVKKKSPSKMNMTELVKYASSINVVVKPDMKKKHILKKIREASK